MRCDPSMVKLWLVLIMMAIFGAVACVAAAIAANGSIVQIYLAPGFMWGAAGFASGAITFCGILFSELNKLAECAPKCAPVCSDIRGSVIIVMSALMVQVAACIVSAAFTLIPVFGAAISLVILIALAAAAFAIAMLLVNGTWAKLDACVI